jgi:hypothetical protein
MLHQQPRGPFKPPALAFQPFANGFGTNRAVMDDAQCSNHGAKKEAGEIPDRV